MHLLTQGSKKGFIHIKRTGLLHIIKLGLALRHVLPYTGVNTKNRELKLTKTTLDLLGTQKKIK